MASVIVGCILLILNVGYVNHAAHFAGMNGLFLHFGKLHLMY